MAKLKIFHTQNIATKKAKRHITTTTGKIDEVTALLHLTQLDVNGCEVNIINFIGRHEWNQLLPSLFNENGLMRAGGTKSKLIKSLKKETQVTTDFHLPKSKLKTAAVVETMFAVSQWSFNKGEAFGTIAKRYLHNMQNDIFEVSIFAVTDMTQTVSKLHTTNTGMPSQKKQMLKSVNNMLLLLHKCTKYF